MEHVLQQAYGLEADGLASGVGTGYEQYALGGGERYGKGDDGLVFLAQGLLQQGVARLAQADAAVFGNYGQAGDEVEGRLRLGHQEIHLADERGAGHYLRQVGTQEVGEFPQDAGDFPGLGEVEFAYFVLYFQYLGWLYEGGLAGGGFVIHEALELALGGGGDGDEVLAVAYGDCGLGGHQACLLGLLEYGGGAAGNGALFLAEAFAYVEQFRGCGVLDVAVAVEYGLYAPGDFREDRNGRAEALEVGVDAVLDAGEEGGYAADGVEHRLQLAQSEGVDAGALVLQRGEEGKAVDVSGGGEVLLEKQHQAHFLSDPEALFYCAAGGAELFLRHPFGGVVGHASVGDYRPYLVESQFGLEPVVCHLPWSLSLRTLMVSIRVMMLCWT